MIDIAQVKDDPVIGFATEPLEEGGGYRWSLTTIFGRLLRDAQERFGPRDHTYTPIGIEFYGDHPQIWFPGNCGHVSIMLSENARTDVKRAVFQLAHETIHLLSPGGQTDIAPVVEEGLATLYSDEISARLGLGYRTDGLAYLASKAACQNLLSKVGPDIVKRLRAVEPYFSHWRPAFLVDAGVEAPIATLLCMPFVLLESQIPDEAM